MENKEMKKPIPVELEDDALENVSGGAYTECNRGYTCPECSSDRIRVFDKDDELIYFCFDCGRGTKLNV